MVTQINPLINMVTVYYNGFWNGFSDETDGINVRFFNDFFKKLGLDAKSSVNIEECDALVESFFTDCQLVGTRQWRWSIFFSGESYTPNKYEDYTLVLWSNKSYKNAIGAPLLIAYTHLHPERYLRSVIVPSRNICGVVSNGDSQIRNRVLAALIADFQIDMAGKHLNNVGYVVGGSYWDPLLVDYYHGYKFALAFENTIGDYYITEKIVNVLKAGVIPIYLGSPNIGRYINKNRIVIVDLYHIERTLDRIREILGDPQEWLRIVSLPIFVVEPEILFDNLVAEARPLIMKNYEN